MRKLTDFYNQNGAGLSVPASVLWGLVADRVTQVNGQLHPGQERTLFEWAYGLPDGAHILEIGALKGRSTVCLGFGCLGTQKRVTTIDTFRGDPADTNRQLDESFLPEFLDNVNRCGLADYITPLVGFSREYWQGWDKPLGLLFVDGGHSYEDVRGDLEAFFPALLPGGLLAMHDVWSLTEAGRDTERAWLDVLPELNAPAVDHNLAWGWKR